MPTIETNRLIIREPRVTDAKQLNDAINRSLPELQAWMPWASDPSLQTTETFIAKSIEQWSSPNQNDYPLVVELKDSGILIGASGYNDSSDRSIPFYEVGYWLETLYVGNGYATEIVSALTQFAFNTFNAVRVQIRAQCDNYKSISVAKRCGYQYEATLKKVRLDCRTKQPCDEVIYSCFK